MLITIVECHHKNASSLISINGNQTNFSTSIMITGKQKNSNHS